MPFALRVAVVCVVFAIACEHDSSLVAAQLSQPSSARTPTRREPKRKEEPTATNVGNAPAGVVAGCQQLTAATLEKASKMMPTDAALSAPRFIDVIVDARLCRSGEQWTPVFLLLTPKSLDAEADPRHAWEAKRKLQGMNEPVLSAVKCRLLSAGASAVQHLHVQEPEDEDYLPGDEVAPPNTEHCVDVVDTVFVTPSVRSIELWVNDQKLRTFVRPQGPPQVEALVLEGPPPQVALRLQPARADFDASLTRTNAYGTELETGDDASGEDLAACSGGWLVLEPLRVAPNAGDLLDLLMIGPFGRWHFRAAAK